ncbi:MAG: ribonuclease T [Epsilonproteobacteria bacterium]|nr:ribonuclease T [Campylobacterota bacterium]
MAKYLLILIFFLEAIFGFSFNFFKKSQDNILALSWHNTFCEFKPNKKECKIDLYNNRLVLHGLWPSKSYCDVPKDIIKLDKSKRWSALPPLNLDESLKKELLIYMPGALSYLHRHEYYKHGSCYSKDPNRYFRDAISLTKEIDESKIGDFLRENIGKRIRINQIQNIFGKIYGRENRFKIAIFCNRGLLKEIRISLKGKGDKIKDLLKGAKRIRGNCVEAIVDGAGLFRKRRR